MAILKNNNKTEREQKLIKYIKATFSYRPIITLSYDKSELDMLLAQYNVETKQAYLYFIDAVCQQRQEQFADAKYSLVKAIDVAGKEQNHYLLYSFFSTLAFWQTSAGSTTEAVQNFGRAKKEALIMNDYYSQVIVDINISDIYYKNNIYLQSLFYLSQARSIVSVNNITEARLINIIYYNTAENHFRMNNIDSLKKYNRLLNDKKRGRYKLHTFRNRTGYYLLLLNHNYSGAINHIKALRTDTAYKFDDTDEQNLADAYYSADMPDSAKTIIDSLLVKQSQNNHPEIKTHLYKVLGNIAQKENNQEQAAYNFKMALLQSEDQIQRLTKVGDISAQMNIDEVQRSYNQKEEHYRNQRMWLVFILIASVLSLAAGTLFYRNVKQKRYYEKLLFDAQKEELAFINSHEVRRHLANILGIIEMIKQSENRETEYAEFEDHLLNAAKSLDEAIKNIQEKLDS
jgi:hypothetical protein